MRKTLACLLAMVLLLSICLSGTAFASEKVQKLQTHYVSTLYVGESIPVPELFALTDNVFYTYTKPTAGVHTAQKIEGFCYVNPMSLSFMIADCHITSLSVGSSTYSSGLTKNTNVMVDPTWIWDDRYKNLSQSLTSGYDVSSSAAIIFDDCLPSSAVVTTTSSLIP